MASVKLPETVELGPHIYTVSEDRADYLEACREETADLVGHIDHEALSIVIDPEVAPSCKRDTLLHEILHGIATSTGLATEWGVEKEEAIVRRLSPVLLDMLRRNPAVTAYLTADAVR